MSAQPQVPAKNTAGNASLVMAMVSPRDGCIAITPVLPDDMANLFVWLNDADAARSDFPYRPVDGVSFKKWLDEQSLCSQILFMIRTIAVPRPIGFLHIKNLNPVYRSAELGLRIGEEADRGQGYGRRALLLALSYAWDSLNLHRVHLTVLAGNRRAIASYRRAGFREEGVLRQAAYVEGSWHDILVMAAINPRETAS